MDITGMNSSTLSDLADILTSNTDEDEDEDEPRPGAQAVHPPWRQVPGVVPAPQGPKTVPPP
eukprot:10984643-Karenia_brevis.AAC.1